MKKATTLERSFSFTKGLLRLFGFDGRRIDEMRRVISQRTDSEALAGDWQAIGGDMKKALSKAECSY